MSPLTPAKKKANAKWDKENLDKILIVTKKGNKDKIKALAKEKGESTNAYIINAVKERALRESGVTLD